MVWVWERKQARTNLLKQWNVGAVVILRPTNMAKCRMVINAIAAPTASQPYKFGKLWEQTIVTTLLVVTYFNWIWRHSRLFSTAAQRAALATRPWSWHDLATYPTIISVTI